MAFYPLENCSNHETTQSECERRRSRLHSVDFNSMSKMINEGREGSVSQARVRETLVKKCNPIHMRTSSRRSRQRVDGSSDNSERILFE